MIYRFLSTLVIFLTLFFVVGCQQQEEPLPPPPLMDRVEGLPQPKLKVRLCSVGEPFPDLARLAESLSQGTGHKVLTGPTLKLPKSAFDSKRKQYQVKPILELLKPQTGEYLLGVTFRDMRAPMHKSYTLSWYETDKALLSLYRLAPENNNQDPDQDLAFERLEKAILGITLEMVYGLPRKEEPGSLLHQPIKSYRDLDAMEYRI